MLDAGSPTPTFVRLGILSAFGIVLSIVSTVATEHILLSFSIVVPAANAIPFIPLLLCFPEVLSTFWNVRHLEFVVEDGCLCGVDLWTVEQVSYGRHCIWLDDVRISGVPQPKVLLDSLEDYYIKLTGEYLP